MTENCLYFGDNLDILRHYIKDESVDLIYLDPPFNSNRAYNVIFQDKTGKKAAAQMRAFEDTWWWSDETQAAYDEMLSGNYPVQLKEMLRAFREFMGPTEMMAYLTMMAIRLHELHRVLKSTGVLYLHCDPTAGHYLKILLDQVFGVKNFRNEIVWKRTESKGNVRKKFGWINDRILFYTKSRSWTWNQQYAPYDQEYVDQFYDKVDENGRRYQATDLTAPMSRASRGQIYTWKGYTPPESRCFVYNKKKMAELDKAGRIEYTKSGCPRYKRYLDEMPGNKCPDIWTDIKIAQKGERLGYPTQKPVALLERIIKASSNEGDVVLDPFCGCGTTIAAAEKLDRRWIGIDITYLAIALIKKRILEHFPDCKFEIVGEPKSTDDAKALFKQSPFQFESWAVSFLGGQPYKSTGGGDTGIDGFLYFQDYKKKYHKVIIEVKGGKYQPRDIRALARVMEREGAPLGVLIALQPPTAGMKREATTLGKWQLPGHDKEFPVLQIVTIDELFKGKLPKLPDTSSTLKRAQRMVKENNQNQLNLK
jgi:site-specific DNA-methyltransferase (adenine-specific)